MRNLFQGSYLGIRNGVWSDRFVRLRQITSWALAAVLASSAMILTVVVGSSLSAPDASATVSSWTAYAVNCDSGDTTYVNNMNTTPAYGGAIATGSASTACASGTSISPNDQYVFATDYSNNQVQVINSASNTVIKTITGNGLGNPLDSAVSPDGTQLWVADYGSNNVSVFCIATGGCGATAQWGPLADITDPNLNLPIDVAITPNGEYAYVSNYNANYITVYCAQSTGCGGILQYGLMSSFGQCANEQPWVLWRLLTF